MRLADAHIYYLVDLRQECIDRQSDILDSCARHEITIEEARERQNVESLWLWEIENYFLFWNRRGGEVGWRWRNRAKE